MLIVDLEKSIQKNPLHGKEKKLRKFLEASL